MLKWLATEIEVRSKAGTVDALISMTCVARSAKTVKTEPIWPYPNLRRYGYREDREGVRPGNLSSDGWAAREYGGLYASTTYRARHARRRGRPRAWPERRLSCALIR
jgi:hypothetical protein